ncbi:hypothetical protein SFC07_09890 [Corynebacterium callunae]|uniref:hypothetical protein n=1 Tax=Corynebacterium callunae TaxID=1721 RepID=UPI0039820BB6
MLTWLLMIVILAALIVIFTWVFAKVFGRGEQSLPLPENNDVIEHNRQVVGAGEIDDIMFETVLRGYRQDQVDDVIAHLKWQVDSLNAKLAEKAVKQDFS